MSRGRPFEPGNKFGRGRPKGTPNRINKAQKIYEDSSAGLMALAINKSREDTPTLRLLVKPMMPKERELPVNIGRLPLETLEDLDRASQKVMKKAASGKITVSEARRFCALIEDRRRVLLAVDLERRVQMLENPLPAESEDPSNH
jgi:hypothetical protein